MKMKTKIIIFRFLRIIIMSIVGFFSGFYLYRTDFFISGEHDFLFSRIIDLICLVVLFLMVFLFVFFIMGKDWDQYKDVQYRKRKIKYRETTPLYEAIKKGSKGESQVDLLLKYGMKLDESCLEAARLSGDKAMIEKVERLMKDSNL